MTLFPYARVAALFLARTDQDPDAARRLRQGLERFLTTTRDRPAISRRYGLREALFYQCLRNIKDVMLLY